MENKLSLLTAEELVAEIGSPKAKPNSVEKLELELNRRRNFQFNVVTGRLEVKRPDQKVFQPMTEYALNSIVRELNKVGINCGPTVVRNLITSDFSPTFHPFKNYLYGLIPYDGVSDPIGQLAETITTTNDPFFRYCLKKWLVCLVGGILDENVTNHCVIVLAGGQGLGKTSWLQNLVPKQLREYLYCGIINPNNRDTLIQISETMLIVMDELESLNKSELSAMKEIITKSNIRVRKAYGYSAETMTRRASFAASVNNKEFLNDTTGNRRFLSFEVLKIDYQKSLPLDQIYAQALHLYKTGFKYWFDPSEIESINKNNEEFRILSVEEELLTGNFEACEPEEGNWFLSTTEIVNWFTKNAKMSLNDNSIRKLGQALHAHKFKRIKKNHRFVWALKLKDPEMESYLQRFNTQNELFEVQE